MVFPIAVTAVVLSDLVPLRGDPGWATRLFICALCAALAWRLFRLAAIGTPDGRLTVRNHWSTRSFAREEIAGVEIDRADGRFGRGWAIWLQLADGSHHRLDVSEVPFRRLFAGRLDHDAEALRMWLAGRPTR